MPKVWLKGEGLCEECLDVESLAEDQPGAENLMRSEQEKSLAEE